MALWSRNQPLPTQSADWCCEGCGSPQRATARVCATCGLDPEGSDPDVGQALRQGRYQLNNRIDGGLLSVVYQALDTQTEQVVALKRVLPQIVEQLGGRHSLQHLLKQWRQFSHPGAPKVTDIFEAQDESICWVSPWLKGEALVAKLRQHRSGLPYEESLHIIEQLCEILQAYHELGLVHAQLRLEQLFLVTSHNNTPRVVLSDMGWGSSIGAHFARRRGLSRDEGTLRALRYIAPEQLLEEHHGVDVRADVYTVGAIFFHLLTGRLPYQKQQREALYKQHLYAPPPRLNMACPNRRFDPSLEELIRHAMAKRPQDRPSSIKAWHQALQRIPHEQAVQMRKTTTQNRTTPTTQSIALSSLPSAPSQPPAEAPPEDPFSSLYLGLKRPSRLWILWVALALLFGLAYWLF